MASIYRRRNKYCVVYRYTDDHGIEKQRWESFDTNSEAKARKNEIEYLQQNGLFTMPTAKTVSDLLNDYVAIYGLNKWAMSTYAANTSMINRYIKPYIGEVNLKDVNTRMIEKFYQKLQTVKSPVINCKKPKSEYLTSSVIHNVHKILRSAFTQAVKWELVQKNPCVNATLPKKDEKERQIWDAETLFKAIELCDDDLLKLALNVAFCCSLRMGEMLGLTWDCVNITDENIRCGNAAIYVNKELQRIEKDALEALGEQDIIKKFPAISCRNSTVLVLKTPKTKSSVRKVYVPKTVALMLQQRFAEIEELKDLFGDEYIDNNLVFCNANGRPLEGQIINRGLHKLIEDNNLPPVVFHSLRHSSVTYKLKLNGGDIKSVQGDSGHSQTSMVTDVYSHIIDEDRKMNAVRFEQAFYSGECDVDTIDVSNEVAKESKTEDKSDAELLFALLQKPGMVDLLRQIIK